MQNEKTASRDYYMVDLKHIFEALWKRAWVIAVISVLAAAIGFSAAAFFMTPKYASSIMLYVNNRDISVGNINFSASDISASRSLVKTYTVILNNRTTLEKVIEEADVAYNYAQLSGMIQASAVNDTEIMRVTVTCEDPYEAARIANTIAKVLPQRIGEIIDGSSMEVVDAAVPILSKVSPSISTYTVIGFLLGMVISVGILAAAAILDDTIHDQDYIVDTYSYPLLAVVPDLLSDRAGQYGYYSHAGGKRRQK